MRWVVLLFMSLVTTEALAQGGSDDEARARFEAGRLAYSAGRYEDALADFVRAHEQSGRAALLFNIGQCHDRLRHDAEALDAFDRFLRETPEDTPGRDVAERRVAFLREQLAREGTAETTSASAAASSDTPPPDGSGASETSVVEGATAGSSVDASSESGGSNGSSALGLTALIAGAAVAVGGGVMIGLGAADRASVEGAPDAARWSEYQDAASRAPVLEGVGIALLGVGLAAAGLGIVLLSTSSSSSEEEVALRVGPGTVEVGGRF